MQVEVPAAGFAGFTPVTAALGALALQCFLVAVAFAVKGFGDARRCWHSWAVLAASVGVVAVVSALVLALAGC